MKRLPDPCARKSRASGAGFTLIELLVVVAIIAVLISILLPSLAKAKRQAIRTKCAANLRSWGTGIYAYSSEYGGQIPRSWARGSACSVFWLSQTRAGAYVGEMSVENMLPYTAGVDAPSYTTYLNALGSTGAGPPWTPLPMKASWICPAAVNSSNICYAGQFQNTSTHIHYQYFGRVNTWPTTGTDYSVPPYTPRKTELTDQITNSSAQQLLMSDMVYWQSGWLYNHGITDSHPVWTNEGNGAPVFSNTAVGNEGINKLFADGHVEWRPFSSKETTLMDTTAAGGFTDLTLSRANHNFY